MTRIMTNPELVKPGRKPPISEEVWFSRDVLALGVGAFVIWVSDLVRDGTRISEIQIQARPVDKTETLGMEVRVCIVNTKAPVPQNVRDAEQVIRWSENPAVRGWVPLSQEVDERWPCAKVVRGSDQRICIEIDSATASGIVARVAVRHTV